jgi:hypothetical protein
MTKKRKRGERCKKLAQKTLRRLAVAQPYIKLVIQYACLVAPTVLEIINRH